MKVRILREQHEAPEWAQRLLILAGGTNRFGKPNYRWVWGWSRLTWIGGMWTDWNPTGGVLRQAFELRQVPAHEPHDRWHLEKWIPPEVYGSPRMWALTTRESYGGRSLDALGPYPQFGEYEHSLTLDEPCRACIRKGQAQNCDHRGFAQLTPEIAFRMARALEFSRKYTETERRDAVEKCHQRDAMQDDKAIDEILGSDPGMIDKNRKQYLDRVIAPQMEWAVAKAHQRKQQGYRTAPGYKVSAGPIQIAHK